MPRTFTNGAIIVAALVLAVLPLIAMRTMLEQHATREAERSLAYVAERMLAHVEAVVADASDALANAAVEARPDCATSTQAVIARAAIAASHVRMLAVYEPGGRLACRAGDVPLDQIPAPLAFRPARVPHLALAAWAGADGRWRLALRHTDPAVTLIAFVAPDAHVLDLLPPNWRGTAIGTISLDDARVVGAVPQGWETRLPDPKPGTLLTTQRTSERFPVTVATSVPFNTVLAGEKSIAVLVDVGGGLLAVLFLGFVVNVVRRPQRVEDAVRLGLQRDEFIPYYQPVFDIQSGTLVGCEVLVRWRRDDGTMVPPGAFIQQAEESGIAVEMTRSLMRKARDEMGRAYAPRAQLKLAFNLFADHFSDLSTVEDVRKIFREGGVRYTQLVFEVTERYPLPNLNRAKVAISGLQALGCRVALDDAGTGHGGLAYLQKLGMDQIKIDKLFVDTITSTSLASPIVDSLCDLGRSLGMEIVAEGVENTDQLAYLRSHGVHCAQGFLFAKPLPGEAYIRLIEAMLPLRPAEDAGVKVERAAA